MRKNIINFLLGKQNEMYPTIIIQLMKMIMTIMIMMMMMMDVLIVGALYQKHQYLQHL